MCGAQQNRAALERFGKIKSVDFIRDSKSNKLRGYGFVYYERLEDAERAIREHEGRGLVVADLRVRLDYSKNQNHFARSELGSRGPPPPPFRGGKRSPRYVPPLRAGADTPRHAQPIA